MQRNYRHGLVGVVGQAGGKEGRLNPQGKVASEELELVIVQGLEGVEEKRGKLVEASSRWQVSLGSQVKSFALFVHLACMLLI